MIAIETVPIADGQTSYAFIIYDQTRKMNMIGKIDKKVFDGIYKNDYDTAHSRLTTQRYAIQMGRCFRQLTAEFNGPPIFFLPPTIYKLSEPFNGVKYIYAEPKIDMNQW